MLNQLIVDNISGDNPKYKVLNNGNVYGPSGKLLSQSLRSGYKSILIYGNNYQSIQVKVHRLVAYLYCENPNNCNVVNHKDGNKLNNHYTNLEWITSSENQLHAIELGLRTFDSTSCENNYLTTFTEAQLRECLNHPNFNPLMSLKDFKLIVEPLNCTLAQTKSLLYGNSWLSVTKDYGIIKRDELDKEHRPAPDLARKLTEKQVCEIHKLLFEGKSDTEISNLTGYVSNTTVGKIRTGKLWAHIKPEQPFPKVNGRQAINKEQLKSIQSKLNSGVAGSIIARDFNISTSLVSQINRNVVPAYLT